MGEGHRKRISGRRIELGITQAALASAVGVSATYIHQIESAKRTAVGMTVLKSMADCLGLNLDYLLYGTEPRLAVLQKPLFTDDEMSLIYTYRKLGKIEKDMARKMLAALIDLDDD